MKQIVIGSAIIIGIIMLFIIGLNKQTQPVDGQTMVNVTTFGPHCFVMKCPL